MSPSATRSCTSKTRTTPGSRASGRPSSRRSPCRRHGAAGIGAALMDAVDGELGRLGVDDLGLVVVAGNTEALRFYERRGLRAYAHRMHRGRVPRDG